LPSSTARASCKAPTAAATMTSARWCAPGCPQSGEWRATRSIISLMRRVAARRTSGDWRGFFFRAEDGIRARTVTGVQTCALPIYDMLILTRNGITPRGLAFDTMLGAYLTDPGRRGLGLKDQAFQRLGIVMTPISQLIGTGSKMISMAQVPIRLAADYAGADADMTLRLVEPIKGELRRHSLMNLYTSIELPLLPVLLKMEMYGVALDAAFLAELESTLAEQIGVLEHEIYDTVGHHFNINSTKQLGDILFGELKLPSGRKTKTGYSVSADVIESLRGKHPMVDYLLEYRQLTKLKSTYVDGLLALMDPVTVRVHTSFNQTVAASGRLSSSNPNLQNIPVRTEVGRQIRRAFIADPSYVLLTADYSQFELRILAHITHEPRLVEAFSKGEDIHTITAASLFN